jgi:hypothetical protein
MKWRILGLMDTGAIRGHCAARAGCGVEVWDIRRVGKPRVPGTVSGKS